MFKDSKSRDAIIDSKSRDANSYLNVNKGQSPSGNTPESSNQLNLLDSVIDVDLLYSHFNAVKDWQKENINKTLSVYKNLLIKYLLERSHYTPGADLYQFPHYKFDREVGTISIYGSKPAKEESFVQVMLQLFNLYTLEVTGTNLTKKVSLMKLNLELTRLIDGHMTEELLVNLYGNIDITDTKLVDLTPIDIRSLEAYIKGNNKLSYQNETVKNYNRQANMILQIAKLTNGVFPQIINESNFGRRYYKGQSLQIISSVVRKACLGNHFEYDLNAAVYAIKLNICSFLSDKKFTYTTEYLEYKDAIRKRISNTVFKDTDKFHIDIIKQALTSIGFGARPNGRGYFDDNGTWTQTSLQDIFSYKNKETNKKVLAKDKFDSFINDTWIKEFLREQQEMTEIITKYYKDNKLVTKETHPFLLDGRNAINNNQLMAYVFQTLERKIMDSACEFIESSGAKVLLRVHDAVYTDRKINMRELHVKIYQEFQSPELEWAGPKTISFEEIETMGFYYDDEDESDIEETWEKLTGIKSTKVKTKRMIASIPTSIEGYYTDKCDYGQTQYDPNNDPYVQDMTNEERKEHYRIVGYNKDSVIDELLLK